jgi:hypothetical protein
MFAAPSSILAPAALLLAAVAGCWDAKGKKQGLMEAKSIERLDPTLGDFVFAVDSLAYTPSSRPDALGTLTVYAHTADTSCASIAIWRQDEGESLFVEAYGIRAKFPANSKYGPTPECIARERTIDTPGWGLQIPMRQVSIVLLQPDGTERHVPIILRDSAMPPAPAPPRPAGAKPK